MSKNIIGLGFFIIALLFLFNPMLTGNVIGGEISFNISFILGLVFLCGAFMFFVSRQKLDAIIIPTGPSKEIDVERAERAVKKYDYGKGADYLIISGGVEGKETLKQKGTWDIYSTLRKYGIRPANIKIEGKSKNTLENLIYSLKKIKKSGAKKIGIASNPSHLNRFHDVLKVAKREGVVGRDFKIYNLPTSESFADKFYGVFSRMFYQYKLSKGLKKAEKTNMPNWIKNAFVYVYRLLGK